MADNTEKMLLNPELWVKNYADSLFSFALKRVNNEEVAQDLVQETFLGALKSRNNFDGKSSEKTWLIAILKFKIIDHYRLKSKKQTSSLHQSDGEEIENHYFEPKDGHFIPQPSLIQSFANSDDELLKREFYKTLENCLKKLPSKLAIVFKLKMLLEEDADVICETLNITNTNYWVILHRAKLQLRDCMTNLR
ncbi:sigma-70 family RNA polymerase sigma factor [Pedobacter cryophilus]|uniref:RNA polymerase sigma factor n=1 Tax=Pedobacter cryophilus TaxID=2571271 RepID=A0A4U1BZ84_9SPHI|nr:sigma-70 family RNA polymerase sigma factor [Pedobacter cryophilus]TKB95897.1 sigma-70 family RNA polymerase sigma factor [Pedobacter cryophilus]